MSVTDDTNPPNSEFRSNADCQDMPTDLDSELEDTLSKVADSTGGRVEHEDLQVTEGIEPAGFPSVSDAREPGSEEEPQTEEHPTSDGQDMYGFLQEANETMDSVQPESSDQPARWTPGDAAPSLDDPEANVESSQTAGDTAVNIDADLFASADDSAIHNEMVSELVPGFALPEGEDSEFAYEDVQEDTAPYFVDNQVNADEEAAIEPIPLPEEVESGNELFGIDISADDEPSGFEQASPEGNEFHSESDTEFSPLVDEEDEETEVGGANTSQQDTHSPGMEMARPDTDISGEETDEVSHPNNKLIGNIIFFGGALAIVGLLALVFWPSTDDPEVTATKTAFTPVEQKPPAPDQKEMPVAKAVVNESQQPNTNQFMVDPPVTDPDGPSTQTPLPVGSASITADQNITGEDEPFTFKEDLTSPVSSTKNKASGETPQMIQPGITEKDIELKIQTYITEREAAEREKYEKMQALYQTTKSELEKVENELVRLSKVDQQLQKELRNAKAKPKAPKKAKTVKKKSPPRYKLIGATYGHAVIKTRNGKTVTINPGENLIGYGRVLRIDVRGCVFTEKGILRTSTASCIDQ